MATAITPSRDSQEVRHCENARQARSGRPRCVVEAMQAAGDEDERQPQSRHAQPALGRNGIQHAEEREPGEQPETRRRKPS